MTFNPTNVTQIQKMYSGKINEQSYDKAIQTEVYAIVTGTFDL